MSLPPLTAIRAFEAVARHLSFTRAAAELGMTQAAVSYQIRLLEERLGAPLFLRQLYVQVARPGDRRSQLRTVYITAVAPSALHAGGTAATANVGSSDLPPPSPVRRLYSLTSADGEFVSSASAPSHLQQAIADRPDLAFLEKCIGLASERLVASLFLPSMAATASSPLHRNASGRSFDAASDGSASRHHHRTS